MIRSLSLTVLALLLALPATAQNTVTFQFSGFNEEVDVTGLTALVYSYNTGQETIERVLGADGLVVLENVPLGMYRAYLAPNDRAIVRSSPGASVGVGSDTFYERIRVSSVDPTRGFVQGRVTVANSGDPVHHSYLRLPAEWGGSPFNAAIIDGDGRFAFQLIPGNYQALLDFRRTFSDPEPEGTYRPVQIAINIAAGEAVTRNLVTEIVETGLVTGRVTDAETGAPIQDALVVAYGTGAFGVGIDYTGADGQYTLAAPQGPEYVVYARRADGDGPNYVRQYYDGAFFLPDATLVEIEAEATTENIDFELSTPASDFSVSLQATLSSTDGTPLDGLATIYDRVNGGEQTVPVVGGVFEFVSDDPHWAGLQMSVAFSAPGYRFEYFDDSTTDWGAQVFGIGPDPISFDLGEVVLLADGEEEPGLAISGTVTSEDGGAPLAGAVVTAQRLDAPGIRYAVTDAAGAYRIGGLDAGDYAVLFTESDHIPEFYPDAATWLDAERIMLTTSRDAVDGLMGGLNRPVGANKDQALLATASQSGAPFVQAGTISGTVRAADGATVMGAVVTAAGPDGTEAYALTDGLGQFSMDVDSPTVTVTADRSRYDAQSRFVNAGGDGQMLMTLTPSSAVSSEDAPGDVASALRVFPNPTRSTITVVFDAAADAQINVYDVLGRQVLRAAARAGADRVMLDTAPLAPGRYVVRVLSGDRAETQPLTVVR